ncbi:EamA family transporter RarD [Primorskyibacter sp. S187A]|uniref:EamA family transporter RarD n=1 Tax=Primorskyibacter sp. S187A TaxID=3415130 RepID=UPI003C7B86B0
MRRETVGVLMMVGTCLVWGLSPLYYALLQHIPPQDVLAHRVVWSLVFFMLLLGAQGRLRALVPLLAWRSIGWVMLAAACIWANWYTFVWSIGAGRVTEASLGYFIFPLVSVVFGAALFGERLGRLQWVSVALAALAVLVLTLGLGVPPWISLILAVTFGLYGLLKKRIQAGPVVSVTAEVVVSLPLALVLLWDSPEGYGASISWRDLGLLILSGPLTALPLVLFSAATKRIRLATVGLLQYLNPTLQFLCAVAVLGESLGFWYSVTFPVIWIALALYSVAAFAAERNRSMASSTLAATDHSPRSDASAKP